MPRASPQTSRLATWAVAGIRVPPLERRSPSSLRRATRRRSCSILIGSLPTAEAMFSGTSVNATRRRSAPAALVEALLLDAEVVRDLVDDGDCHLVDHVVLGLADVADGLAVDHDPVRQVAGVLPAALGQRVTLVEPEQVGLLLVAVLHEDDDV